MLRTRSRQEKAVVRALESRGAYPYLPLIPRSRLLRGQDVVSEVPLFPGYVFLLGQPEQAYEAITMKRVCQILPVADQMQFCAELDQIRRALAGRAPLALYPFAVVGRRCRIARGPFRGIEGVVIECPRPTRLILAVDMLGQGAALEIDAGMLEPADG